ncbi:hypothetical protein GFL38_10370 [Rhizobium leguminosarum bv. viciae]|uniref:hypothetical protein n=1 Tax=Rhizobium ruizarguesonis TaxID=2081791 RepID=UPI00143F4421|nr:hypothetical protein [Rhizobium ruizarguesonis]NKJ72668.1 hypothetical protein [Rhizobium leguminosarum bv. viciae]NKQ80345.1 hypothetical protein [Rhizobium ruizarguesonis]
MKTFEELKAKYPRLLRPDFPFMCREGWLGILDAYFEVVDREMPQDAVYEVRQIKEKLGALRIYDSSYGERLSSVKAVTDAHALAEARSFYVCEYCGKRGVWSNRRGYLTTVCDDHAVRDGYRAEPCEDGDYTYRETDGVWRRYDPDLDAFVEVESPDWAR